LETDAPYLSPEPFRGKRNESAYLLNVLDKVAVVYGMDKQDIAEITTNNALDIFKT
jgi:TatD DNase family protein